MKAAIAGLHIRYDVPSKCTIVSDVLNKQYNTKEQLNEYIDSLAMKYQVSSTIIKLWCVKYETTYTQGMQLPDGVMSMEFNPIKKKSIPKVQDELSKLRASLEALRDKHHPCRTNTPSEILGELINTTV